MGLHFFATPSEFLAHESYGSDEPITRNFSQYAWYKEIFFQKNILNSYSKPARCGSRARTRKVISVIAQFYVTTYLLGYLLSILLPCYDLENEVKDIVIFNIHDIHFILDNNHNFKLANLEELYEPILSTEE